jgi:dolichol kinase
MMSAGGTMSAGDVVGLVASYVYAFGILLLLEAVGRRLGWRQAFTRKIIHIAAGMWVWALLALFDHWTLGIVPFATFIVLNFVFYRRQTFQAMDASDSSPGTVYFAISITLLLALLWRTDGARDNAPIAVAAIMAMTWGDAMASIVGMRWGRHTYTVFGHTRSWQGSAAMAVATAAAVSLTLLVLPGSSLSPASPRLEAPAVLIATALATVTSTVAEGLSPAGTDNLSVPLACGGTLFLTQMVLL